MVAAHVVRQAAKASKVIHDMRGLVPLNGVPSVTLTAVLVKRVRLRFVECVLATQICDGPSLPLSRPPDVVDLVEGLLV
jgi:hypothetical protein